MKVQLPATTADSNGNGNGNSKCHHEAAAATITTAKNTAFAPDGGRSCVGLAVSAAAVGALTAVGICWTTTIVAIYGTSAVAGSSIITIVGLAPVQ